MSEQQIMHHKLIKANIALFNGARAETLRFLEEYDEEVGKMSDPAALSLYLWLEAQSQSTREDRIAALEALVQQVGTDDTYGRLAQAYLDEERAYEAEQQQSGRAPRVLGLPVWAVVVILVFVGIGAFLGIMLLVPPADVGAGDTTPTAPPVISQGNLTTTDLAIGEYEAQFDSGLIQLTALADNVTDVIDINQGIPLEPIGGARFYAVNMVFECRIAICDQPPEADLYLRLDDNQAVQSRRFAVVQGEAMLEPVAQGNSTTGWVVFEIPEEGVVTGLAVFPDSDAFETPTPSIIDLPPADAAAAE